MLPDIMRLQLNMRSALRNQTSEQLETCREGREGPPREKKANKTVTWYFWVEGEEREEEREWVKATGLLANEKNLIAEQALASKLGTLIQTKNE